MSTAVDLDLARVFLILGSFPATPPILSLSNNSRYEFKPLDNNAESSSKGGNPNENEPEPPLLALILGEHMPDPQGWILGSSSSKSNIRLVGPEDRGTSRKAIRVDISPTTFRPRLTILPGSGIVQILEHRIVDDKNKTGDKEEKDAGKPIICKPGQTFEIKHPITVKTGLKGKFQAWIPSRTDIQHDEHMEMVQNFRKYMISAQGNSEISDDDLGKPKERLFRAI